MTKDSLLRKQLRVAVEAGLDKRALDPVVLDVRKVAGFCDYFMLCHGGNPRQIKTIAEAIEERLEQKYKLQPQHRDGREPAEWIVLDYMDFIIHVFSAKSRKFYDMERLWAQAIRVKVKTEREGMIEND